MEEKKIILADGSQCDVSDLCYKDNRTLLNSYTKALAEDRDGDAEVFLHRILDRFECESCTRGGESKDELFARQFSAYVNRCPNNFEAAAKKMSCEHRYLQNEMFKVFMHYVKILAKNCECGCYDPRNRYAAKTSKEIIDHFKNIGYPY